MSRRPPVRLGALAAGAALAGACTPPSTVEPCGAAPCGLDARCVFEASGPRCRPRCERDTDCSEGICGRAANGDGICRPPPPPCRGPGDACPSGLTCQPRPGADAGWGCGAAGTRELGEACREDAPCRAGAVCVELAPSGGGRCALPCQTTRDCPPPSTCRLEIRALRIGLCDPMVLER